MEDNKLHMVDGYDFATTEYLPPRKIIFEGISLYTPKRPFVVLDAMYKDWRKYIRIFSWCHKLKKPIYKKQIFPIQINKSGRIKIDLSGFDIEESYK